MAAAGRPSLPWRSGRPDGRGPIATPFTGQPTAQMRFGAPEVAGCDGAQFRADVLALLDSLDKAACAGYLPPYLPQGADITGMARTVRVVGEVRRGPAADETGLDPRPGVNRRDQARMYALPAEQGARAEAPQPWEQLAEEYQQLVVLADPGWASLG